MDIKKATPEELEARIRKIKEAAEAELQRRGMSKAEAAKFLGQKGRKPRKPAG